MDMTTGIERRQRHWLCIDFDFKCTQILEADFDTLQAHRNTLAGTLKKVASPLMCPTVSFRFP